MPLAMDDAFADAVGDAFGDATGNALLQLAQVGMNPLLLVAEQVGLEHPRGPKSCRSDTHRGRVCPVMRCSSCRNDIQALPPHGACPGLFSQELGTFWCLCSGMDNHPPKFLIKHCPVPTVRFNKFVISEKSLFQVYSHVNIKPLALWLQEYSVSLSQKADSSVPLQLPGSPGRWGQERSCLDTLHPSLEGRASILGLGVWKILSQQEGWESFSWFNG